MGFSGTRRSTRHWRLNSSRRSIDTWSIWVWSRIHIRKERLRSKGTRTSSNGLSPMMDERNIVEKDLSHVASRMETSPPKLGSATRRTEEKGSTRRWLVRQLLVHIIELQSELTLFKFEI
jgi:hypothetical protein